MEFVLVVKRYDLFDLAFPHGFVSDDRVGAWTGRIRSRGFFLERRQAERDSSFKQVIPYTVVTCGHEVFLLERLAQGGEQRLHGKLSIGVGGHVNPVDDGRDVLDSGCRRELEEELLLDCGYELQAVGAINDESGDVGSVHFGLVHVARCASREVRVRETDVLEGRFVPLDELKRRARDERGRFETWSALILDQIDAILIDANPGQEAIWHLTLDGQPAAPGAEGFVHASFTRQLAGTLAVHFAGAPRVVLLRLDPRSLGARLQLEPSRGGQVFPHVHGQVLPQDVTGRVTLARDAAGLFDLRSLP